MGVIASGTPTVEDPDEATLGPAMLRLTDAQRRFVMAMVFIGGSQRACALAAGYKDTPGNPNALEVWGHRLAHSEKIQAAMQEVGMGMLGAGRIPAVKFILDTIRNESAEMKDRIKAAEMVMNRTGLHATTEHKVAVTHKDETNEQLIKEISLMAKTLGVDPKKLLGGKILEAEFEEVKQTSADDSETTFDENSIEDIL